MTLIEALQSVSDYRRVRSKRHPLWVMLVTIVMGNLVGYWSNRPLATFAERYGHEIAQLLQVELSAMPSYSTFDARNEPLILGVTTCILETSVSWWIHH